MQVAVLVTMYEVGFWLASLARTDTLAMSVPL
jgi:hypothetical protein